MAAAVSPFDEPAKVYPATGQADCWVVESPPPRSTSQQPLPTTQFTGTNARTLALRYAYETFGSARFFPF